MDKKRTTAIRIISFKKINQLPFITEKKSPIIRLTDKQNKLFIFLEKKNASQFDGIVLVCSPEEMQKQRMNSRDRLSVDEINKRLSAQMNIREKEKIALNDKSKNIFIVRNDGDLDQLRQELKKTLALIGG